jgi:hypothetical protein
MTLRAEQHTKRDVAGCEPADRYATAVVAVGNRAGRDVHERQAEKPGVRTILHGTSEKSLQRSVRATTP